MDAADMDLSPSPASPDPADEHLNGRVPLITALAIVGVLALFLLHVLGSFRRMSSSKLLHAVVLGAYTLSYSLAGYTLGLMRSSDYYVDEFTVWAVCLLLFLGSTDSLMACRLNDIDNWKSFFVNHLLTGVLVMYIVILVAFLSPESRYIQAPTWAILFVIILRSYSRMTSMRMASRSHLLCKNVKPIADYMQQEHQLRDSDQTPDPVTMRGYRYVVTGELSQKYEVKRPEYVLRYNEEDAKITTVEQIWQCTGTLLCCGRGMQLKDLCLSMALSKMLNRRFAGFKLAEAKLEKTHEFVFGGLLVGDKPYERVFRVIELELAFVHDLYYTRYPYLYHKGRFFALCLPVTMVILCLWLTYDLFKQPDKEKYLDTTLFLMAVVTTLEIFQLYLHMASDWFKVALIRSYITRPVLQMNSCFFQIIGLLLRLKALRPWEHKLGQYSLLHSFDGTRRINSCLHYVPLCLVDKARKGRKRGKLVKLSTQVKQAVVHSLIDSKGRLTNGVRSLRNNGVHEQLSWACDVGNETATYTILVWHIATIFCKHQLDAQPKDKQLLALSEEDRSAIDTASSVATSLSQYCAYLVAFAPNLLPDHSSVSTLVLDESIIEARRKLKGAKTMESKCEKLMGIIAADDADASPVVLGGRLARQLTKDIRQPALRWKVLSDFWAEMMLYIAPCDDAQARVHLEALARGGEFITHLWALLTHAGVLDRGPAGPQSAV